MRIQKYLSEQNICSRRKAETYLANGWIKINGQTVTEPGTKINPATDHVELASEINQIQATSTCLAFYKPRGIITNCPQAGETEITSLLPAKYRHLSAIGRLDKDSEGLILLTDDGILAKNMLQTEPPHARVYEVWLNTAMTPTQKQKMEEGLPLFGRITRPLTISLLTPTQIEITMTEGKNRQIRRMLQKVGLFVTRLKRTSFGKFSLESLKPGQYRILKIN